MSETPRFHGRQIVLVTLAPWWFNSACSMRTVAIVVFAIAAICGPARAQTGGTYIGFWADGFHDGYKTPQQVDQLIADAKRAGASAIFPEIRVRANSFYLKSLEPPVHDPAYSPDYDALADLIAKAHAAGIYQLNLEIPADAPAGDMVPVVVAMAGRGSNAAFLSIR
jgi:uncharacterized lipoprotein YddW (UPF0748 family)